MLTIATLIFWTIIILKALQTNRSVDAGCGLLLSFAITVSGDVAIVYLVITYLLPH